MKKPSHSNANSNLPTKAKETKIKKCFFPNMSNEEAIKKSLKLLGVTNQMYEKQTKMLLTGELFAKNVNPSTTKAFFLICRVSMSHLCSSDQRAELEMWYPPRTVNQQIQFKKVFYKLLQRLQSQSTIPKNIILSKVTIMGEASLPSLLQFFRALTELALRALYIDKYSKNQPLIQIALNHPPNAPENDINKFYLYPFCQTQTTFESPIASQIELSHIKTLFKLYIERYRKKILNLKLNQTQHNINPQKMMSEIVEQRQLAQTLQKKVNKSIYGENRAFDRRIIMEKHGQIIKQLQQVDCHFIEDIDNSVLRMEGQTSKLLGNWKTCSGTHSLIEFTSLNAWLSEIRTKWSAKMAEFNELKRQIALKIKL